MSEIQKRLDAFVEIERIQPMFQQIGIEAPRGKPRGNLDSIRENRELLAYTAASSGECARGIQMGTECRSFTASLLEQPAVEVVPVGINQ